MHAHLHTPSAHMRMPRVTRARQVGVTSLSPSISVHIRAHSRPRAQKAHRSFDMHASGSAVENKASITPTRRSTSTLRQEQIGRRTSYENQYSHSPTLGSTSLHLRWNIQSALICTRIVTGTQEYTMLRHIVNTILHYFLRILGYSVYVPTIAKSVDQITAPHFVKAA